MTYVKPIKDSIFINPLTEQDTFNYIRNLDSNKSTKSDSPPIKFIKLSAHIIAPIITKIFNSCIANGVFPDRLKSAEVIPIFKKGDKTKLTNWRPISLLSPFSKIFERHLHNQIIQFLNKHNIIHEQQYGFRENKSTELALTQISNELSQNTQNGYFTCSVFVDLAKAFDTVDHSILLSKLQNYGIRGTPFQLLSSYLHDRNQKTIINNKHSNTEKITCGVPQGSILGPLLFNLYINDIVNVSLFTTRLFADDACFTYSLKDPILLQTTVNNEINKINTWLKTNKLSANYSKTNYIIFNNKKKDNYKFNITMEHHQLQRVSEIKYLGVIVDEKLNWQRHIELIKTKISRASYILSKLRHYVNLNTLKLTYYNLVYPYLNYCITVWGGVAKTKLQPLINLQNKILRIITKSSYTSSARPLFIKLNFLPLTQIYQNNLSILLYKIIHNNLTTTYNLQQIDQIHQHNTRLASNSNFYQQFNKTNLGKSTCVHQGLQYWRKIPSEIKTLPFHLFKKRLKLYLLNYFKENIS